MISLSVLHGGPGLVFFAPSVTEQLFGGISAVTGRVDDVPDEDMQTLINKVNDKIAEFLLLYIGAWIHLSSACSLQVRRMKKFCKTH